MRYRLSPTVLSVFALLLCASAANADRSVANIQIEIGNWMFIPTLSDGEVETFVAIRTDAPTGNNITSMWYTLNPDDSWSVWGWEDQDQSKTIGYVKSFLALPDETDSVWPIAPTPVNPADHPAKTMTRGVFSDDPLAEALTTVTDPTELLDFLVSVGWEAARNPVIAGCEDIEPWLQALVDVVDAELIQPGSAQFDQPICQNPPPPTCTPTKVSTTTETCTGTWGAATTTLQPTTGGCWLRNSWSASVTYTQTKTTVFTYSNCSTCTQTETRSRTCTARLAENDTDYGLVSPCSAGIPAGYTPPAASKQPCDCPAGNCIPTNNWGGWTLVGTACPALS